MHQYITSTCPHTDKAINCKIHDLLYLGMMELIFSRGDVDVAGPWSMRGAAKVNGYHDLDSPPVI